MQQGEKEEIIKMFLEARERGEDENFFKALDMESKKVILLYQLDEVEEILKKKIQELR